MLILKSRRINGAAAFPNPTQIITIINERRDFNISTFNINLIHKMQITSSKMDFKNCRLFGILSFSIQTVDTTPFKIPNVKTKAVNLNVIALTAKLVLRKKQTKRAVIIANTVLTTKSSINTLISPRNID